MNVLVAYASRHSSTAGIAQRIAAGLRKAGLQAEARAVGEAGDVGSYDAFVIGAVAYMFHWLKDATRFVERHRDLLAQRPVWLFSSGPLGTDLVDDEGHDVLDATRPREFDKLHELIHPRDEQVFFGAWDPDDPPVGFTERLVRHLPAAEATPAGDFRDWPAIDAWTAAIAGFGPRDILHTMRRRWPPPRLVAASPPGRCSPAPHPMVRGVGAAPCGAARSAVHLGDGAHPDAVGHGSRFWRDRSDGGPRVLRTR